MQTLEQRIIKTQQELQNLQHKRAEEQKSTLLENAKQYINKCYASHQFQRVPKPGKSIYIRKIENVRLDSNGEVVYSYNQIEFLNWHNNTFRVEINRGGSKEPYPAWISSWNYPISPELFDQIEIQVKAHAETYFDFISNLFKQTEYIRMGDSCNEESKYKRLEKAGYSFVDVPQDVFQILSYSNHPFLYETKMLNTQESIEIIRIIAEEMIENAIKWGDSILSRDQPRYDCLMKFYKSLSNA
jgi:hypothetical protein